MREWCSEGGQVYKRDEGEGGKWRSDLPLPLRQSRSPQIQLLCGAGQDSFVCGESSISWPMFRMRSLVGLLTFSGVLGCSAAGEDSKDVLQCCMLKQLAIHCTPPQCYPTLGGQGGQPPCSPPSQTLLEHIQQWRQVGNNGNGDACKAMIDSADNGCFGDVHYNEQDAILACQ